MGNVYNEEKKQFLWGYRDSLRRIERIKAEMEELRMMKASVSAGGGAGRKGWKNDLSGCMARLDELEKDREKELDAMVQVHEQIRRAIDTLEDEQERDVLFYYYIKSMCWREIAGKMHYSERWILKIHGRALAHLKIPKEFIEVQ